LKPKEIETLIKYRLEQAQAAFDDAKYFIDGKRSPQSIINRPYYELFGPTSKKIIGCHFYFNTIIWF